MVAVHGDKGGDGRVGAAARWAVLGVEVIETSGDEAGEGGFAWALKRGGQ